MSLQLINATPRQGLAWVRQAFVLFLRKPLAFASLFGVFMLAALLALALPFVGGVLLLLALPLLTLGYMVAARSALAGGPVNVGQLIEPLRGATDPVHKARRRTLLALCGVYGLLTLAVLLASEAIDGGAFERLQMLLAGEQTDATRAQIAELMTEGSLRNGMLLRLGATALLSLPFWHAPALVAWHGQGLAQALFSSSLACWRNRGAFAIYGLAWVGVVLAFGLVAGVSMSLLGAPQLVSAIAVPAGLIFTTVFYVSLYFTYQGCFGDDEKDTAPV